MDKAERTKQYIVETAADIFNRKGYDGTSFSDIIKGTGLSKGAIYGHFANKDELALAALEHNLKLASKIIFSNVKDRKNSYEKLIGFAQSYSHFFEIIKNAGGCPVINAAVDYDEGNSLFRKSIIKFVIMWQNSITKIIDDGVKKGELRSCEELTVFSSIFISLIEGAIMLSKVMNDRKYVDDASRYLVSLAEKMKA